ncbi:MAG: tetratricopeptide repeat protein [Candidatus Eisenbacteria bacterium]|uniref:Tetratricopeptide repeat protein n=1 Tax=Eiseniibacteriota bacterium TaxID=2212470 RepID=A0A948RY01_UNCEI|nr:tetratricopeptide repeat protein [Candidatus Eisenbacteria bacterium]MBU1949460.1 tetratricopeptide repeat protein [Candidatus Eisenbacteria bacterium]MBU2691637.1 tetratricopeptide repeat protein [Candidatus Eisenbacteria bacterium]
MNQNPKNNWSWLALAGIVIITAIPYLFGLNNGPVIGDADVAWGHPAVNSTPDHSVWNSPYRWNDAGSSWRPLATGSFLWNYTLWGSKRTGYYIVQVVLRMIIAGLFFYLLLRLFSGVLVAFLWGLVAALHPAVSETVFMLSGRSGLLGMVFFLSALLAGAGPEDGKKQNPVLLVVLWASYLLALLSYEATWILLPLLLLYEWLRARAAGRMLEKSMLVRLAPLAGILLMWIMIRGAMGHAEGSADVSGIVAWLGFGQKGLASLAAPYIYLRLLVLPLSLSTNYVHLLNPSGNPASLALILGSFIWMMLAGLFLLSIVRKWPALGLGFGWFLLALSTMLPLFRGQGPVASESLLLLPAGGFVIAAAAGIRRWAASRSPNVVEIVLLIVIATLFGIRTAGRAADFRTDGRRLHVLLQAHPDNAAALFERGNNVLATGRWSDAGEMYLKAVEELNCDPRIWINLGIALQKEEDLSRAVRSYVSAGRILSEHQVSAELAFKLHYNLGLAYSAQGRNELASESLEKALLLKPDNLLVLANLGFVYAQERETFERARDLLLRACQIQNDPVKNEQLMEVVRQIDDILSGRVFENENEGEPFPADERWE